MSDVHLKPLVVGAVSTNCWIIPIRDDIPYRDHAPVGETGPAAVIDPGDEADRIIARLGELHLYPACILLTHGHFDHLAALPALAAAFAANPVAGRAAPVIAIHEADTRYLGPEAYAAHVESFRAVTGDSSFIDKLWKPLPSPTRTLAEGDRIGPFTVLHLPGHSPGSSAFFWEEKKLLFAGDTLFAGGYGRTDLPGGNPTELVESLRRLLTLDGDIRVFPGHGGTTTIDRERQYYRG
jgi:glyoxylase-like metal-dependent hydrolase (beta-lactamase superfamily II)